MENLKWKVGMPNMVVKDCEGHSGGLAMLWKEGVNLKLNMMSRMFIDVDVVEKDDFTWRLTGIYGEPKSDKKELTWRALRMLNTHTRRPWLMCGDFNEILMQGEKEGGEPRQQTNPYGSVQGGIGGLQFVGFGFHR
jgi:hypothetical protein